MFDKPHDPMTDKFFDHIQKTPQTEYMVINLSHKEDLVSKHTIIGHNFIGTMEVIGDRRHIDDADITTEETDRDNLARQAEIEACWNPNDQLVVPTHMISPDPTKDYEQIPLNHSYAQLPSPFHPVTYLASKVSSMPRLVLDLVVASGFIQPYTFLYSAKKRHIMDAMKNHTLTEGVYIPMYAVPLKGAMVRMGLFIKSRPSPLREPRNNTRDGTEYIFANWMLEYQPSLEPRGITEFKPELNTVFRNGTTRYTNGQIITPSYNSDENISLAVDKLCALPMFIQKKRQIGYVI